VTKLSEALEAKRRPTRPSLHQWLETLDADDRKEIMAAATDHQLSLASLVSVIKSCGVATSKETVSVWRIENGFTR
jgi:hypothetical protein